MTHNPNQQELLQAILRRDFSSFIAKCFHTLNPGVEYLPNWHIDLIAEYLMAVQRGEIKRLIINMPPRALKSLCVNVAWPAWLLGHMPHSRIITASYAASLSLRHSTDCRTLVQADWYQWLFPHTRIAKGQNQKHKFVTTEHGYRFASSIAGGITGQGGDFLIIDDPESPMQAAMPKTRAYVNNWFDHTFSTRLDDKERGVIVLVMQRLHTHDLSGYLLERGGWEHICLPAIAPAQTSFCFGTKLWEEGEPLHPARESAGHIAKARQTLGSYAFAAQYLQNPVSENGAVIKPYWLKRYNNRLPDGTRITLSWDTGIKAGPQNDSSACGVFTENEQGYYLLDMQVMKLEYPDLKRAFLQLAAQWQPDAILVEDKASGQQLLQDMKRETKLPIIGINPSQNKLSRLVGVSPLIEAGKLHIPANAPWLAEFERELYAFPNAQHDDQVDALTQFLSWAKGKAVASPTIRRL